MIKCFRIQALALLALCLAPAILAGEAKERRLSRAEYLDKMKAGWIGQMAGVGIGGPTEFRYQEAKVPADQVPAWKPSTVNQFDQDDIYVEMTFLRTLEEHGMGVSSRQAGIDFANSRYPLWHANKAGRDRLREGIAPPDSGHPAYNDHADDIDYQIEADFSGLIAPGLPNTVVRLGEVFGRLMNYGDGLYGGQFVGAMYAEAFFENDVEKIVRAGLAAIPEGSQYHECISDVLAWHAEHPKDWETAWAKIEAKYQKNRDYRRFSCSKDEKEPYKFNIDAKLNGAYIVMGLLYGEGDPEKTIVISTRCGQDSDCNPSNAAGVLFTTIGYSKLPEKYTSGLDTTTKFNSTPYSFSGLVAVCDNLAVQAVRQAGGRTEKSADGTETFVIPVEKPAPSPLETCWEPGPTAESRFTPEEMKQIEADPITIDLRTQQGVDAVKGQWRWHDVTLVPVVGKYEDGSPNKTYNYEPRAMAADYDDSQWEAIKPETLKDRRSTGQICFCWYRINVTLPPEAEGKRVFFQTVVDDYGEVWVDGKLPYKPGDKGGPVAAGFNAPNRVELPDAKPGKVYSLAVFGINGPISFTPTNWIFLGPTFLELVDKK